MLSFRFHLLERISINWILWEASQVPEAELTPERVEMYCSWRA